MISVGGGAEPVKGGPTTGPGKATKVVGTAGGGRRTAANVVGALGAAAAVVALVADFAAIVGTASTTAAQICSLLALGTA